MTRHAHIVVCHECDEVVRVSNPYKEGRYKCPRCGHLLFRHKHGMVEKMFALGIAAAILFIVTNYFPFLSFEAVGNRADANFLTSVEYLLEEHEWLLAVAVLMTTLVVPSIRIVLILTLFGPLYFGRVPRYAPGALKLLDQTLPWAMVDVFLVGVFVSMVKLVKMGSVIPGISLWAFLVMVFVMAAMQTTYNAHMVWDAVEAARKGKA